jgi:hypothetical protein
VFAIPLFGVYLAREWLWYFTPSLSYVGQGELHSQQMSPFDSKSEYRYYHGLSYNGFDESGTSLAFWHDFV